MNLSSTFAHLGIPVSGTIVAEAAKFDLPPEVGLPSVSELAALAATLQRTGEESAAGVVKRALELWRHAESVLAAESCRHKRIGALLTAFRDNPAGQHALQALQGIQWPTDYPLAAKKLAGLAVNELRGQESDTHADAARETRCWLCWREGVRKLGEGQDKKPSDQRPLSYSANDPASFVRHFELLWRNKSPVEAVEDKDGKLFADWNKRQLTEAEFVNEALSFAIWNAHTRAAQVSEVRRSAGREGGKASAKTRKTRTDKQAGTPPPNTQPKKRSRGLLTQ